MNDPTPQDVLETFLFIFAIALCIGVLLGALGFYQDQPTEPGNAQDTIIRY